MVKVLLEEILYLEGRGNYVKVVTRQKEIITYRSLQLWSYNSARRDFCAFINLLL